MSENLVVFTVASRNYLAHVRALMNSVASHHPQARRVLVYCDRPDPDIDLEHEKFDVIFAHDLGIPHFLHFAFKYLPIEFHTAVKPFACQQFLDNSVDRLVFLDADSRLYASLDEALASLDNNDLVLTPQLLRAGMTPEAAANEAIMRMVGSYNTGFLAMRRSPNTDIFLRWWAANLYDHCLNAQPEGFFVDQRLLDLAPGMFDGVAILRHAGVNVMIYNLDGRVLTAAADGSIRAGDRPLVMFHFTGVPGCKPDGQATPYSAGRYDLHQFGPIAARLGDDYRAELERAAFDQFRRLNYHYGGYSDGQRIEPFVRVYFRQQITPNSSDPFDVNRADSVYDLLERQSPDPRLCGYAYALWHGRDDLQALFPRVPGPDSAPFGRWVAGVGERVYGVPARFAQAQRDLLATEDLPV